MATFPQRKSPRLPGYDYHQNGVYFVTICTYQQKHLFGEVINGSMQLNTAGCTAQSCWEVIPNHFAHVELDRFVIMPNHLHGIIILNWDSVSLQSSGMDTPDFVRTRHGVSVQSHERQETFGHPVKGSLAAVIRAYKAAVTQHIKRLLNTDNTRVWHGRYYDHIVRNEADMSRIRAYILYNPARWQEDRFYSRE